MMIDDLIHAVNGLIEIANGELVALDEEPVEVKTEEHGQSLSYQFPDCLLIVYSMHVREQPVYLTAEKSGCNLPVLYHSSVTAYTWKHTIL